MKRIDINHQAQRFSIRKYAFGAASVLIGCVFFLGTQNVSAQEQGTQLPASENAVVNVAENSVAISQAVADKAAAQTTLTETPQVEVEEKENKVNAPALNVDDKGAKSKEDVNPTVSKTASEVEASAVTATDTKNSNPQVNAKTDSSEKDENKMVTSAPAKETEAEQNEKAVAENLIQRQAKAVSIPSQGNYVFQETTPVKNAASMSSPTQFNFDKGDKVFYDKVLEADGHQWISYVSYSGIRRYAPIAVTIEELKQKEIVQQNLPAQGTYHFTKQADVKNDAKLSSPTQFSFYNGDHVFYDKVLEADGHQWISYVSYSGIRRYVVIGKLTTQPSPIETKVSGTIVIQNKTAQQFDVIISNVSSTQGIKEVLVPVWSEQNGQDDIVWYQATKQGEGVYKVTIKVSDHKNNSGNYHVHLYYLLDNGEQRGVGATMTEVEAPKPVETTGIISIANKSSQGFDVLITNASSTQDIKEVLVPVWSEQNGQDDIVWYQATKQGEGVYKVAVKVSDHKNNSGNYNIHLYYRLSTGELRVVGGKTTEVEAPKPVETTGIISIANKSSQGFDVLITNASSTQDIKEVLVPVWSEQNGQDDIIWYQATKQGEGVYKVAVKVSDHKNDSGNYNIHLYYRLSTGELRVVGGKTTTVEAPNRVNLPAQGTYVFTNKVEVKNEARTSSPTQFTFNKGESIYYDSILNADGHQWISYRSYSGIRRYIIID
ncbi:GBS Bsp-like repeat-containing protein [Streptococcus mutans]|uniref:GBS Bsp-like repeat-containing protein n=1 Tax=Streptococcus mutans TaxID=1309 RepID=UPI00124AA6B9|nr:GBS Bsp-like repeat-containing protein [Streptococcus mutans]MCB4993818.1 GBS Bsp-like repeat-containing protein [Streptococcus mutans]MCB5135708.1 GBS Bsp-like repeat-containing protein [Streptococcus mutans]MDT9554851.1 GBS Bsp-like repeat-containing protein [Streptococcus mutans]MDT9558388.1 GBS Bsp-like repeat-containing protein [Streptococcus mutans]MDT9574498.1 GBS Bsp-like repeat-containing protein [Streptococcus mutans]